jgi:hypothetical protein
MAYEMMDDYKRRGFLPPENFDELPTQPNDVRVMNMQDSYTQEQAGQPAATPAPAAGSSTGGGGMRMMDVPEGANIRRTMTLTGEDGQREQTVASWIHSPTKPAQMEQPGRFERLEPFNPEPKARFYTGKINSLNWLGAPPLTYLCRGISAEPVALPNGFYAWRVSYEFEGTADATWLTQIAYVDPTTGEVPDDAVLGNGLNIIQSYQQVDFNALNLSMPL